MKKTLISLSVLLASFKLNAETLVLNSKSSSHLSQMQKAIILMDFKALSESKNKVNLANFLSNLLKYQKENLKGAYLKKILRLLKKMIDGGADVNATTPDYYYSPLHLACENGHKEIAEILIKAGADVNAKTSSYSYTPLHLACENGHKEIAELLIKAGADVNVKISSSSYTPLHLACENGHKEVVELLFFYGVKCEASDNSDINKAMKNGFERFLKKQLELIECNVQYFKKTLEEGNLPEIKTILKYQSINEDLGNGCRPLHIAVIQKNLNLVKFLLENGADPDIKNKDGKTALDLCYDTKDKDTRNLLLISKLLLEHK